MTFKPGDKAKFGVSEVTILGVASNGMYACEYGNGAVGFLNPSDLMPPDPYTKGWNEALDEARANTNNGCISYNELGALKRGAL